MDPHALNGQRTLANVVCTKRKPSEGEGQSRELRNRWRVDKREGVLAAAIAAKPPPPLPRPCPHGQAKAGEASFGNSHREAGGVGSTAALAAA